MAKAQARSARGPALGGVDAWVLAAVVVLAAAVRLEWVTQPLVDGLSWREASTAMMADNFATGTANPLYPRVNWTGTDPGYQGREFQVISWITGMLYRLFGWHDWLGRLVATCFGLWSVFALHRLVEQVWDRTHAHAAALTLALLPAAVAIDTSFLPDAAMLAFVLTGAWLLLLWLRSGGRLRLAGAAAFTALGLLAKLPGAVVLVPLAVAALPVLRRDATARRDLLLAGAAALAPLIAYYSWAVYLGRSYPPYHVAGAGYLWQDLRDSVENLFFIRRAVSLALKWMLTLPVAMLAAFGALAVPPVRGGFPWFFHAWLASGAGLLVLAGREVTNNPWNLLILAAPVAAFAGRGVVLVAGYEWPGRALLKHARAAVAVLAVLWSGQAGLDYIKAPYFEAARQLGRALEEVSSPGGTVIAVAPVIGNPIAIYYSRRRGWTFPPGGGREDWSVLPEDEDAAIRMLEDLRGRGAEWFGLTRAATDRRGRSFIDDLPRVVEHLDETAERTADTPEFIIWRL